MFEVSGLKFQVKAGRESFRSVNENKLNTEASHHTIHPSSNINPDSHPDQTSNLYPLSSNLNKQNMYDLEYKAMLSERVVQVLKTVYDPEIPVNIYDLGLIYEININNEGVAEILMTLTAPNCPVAEDLPVEVRDKVAAVEGIKDCKVTLTFEPPWDRDMISETGLLELGFL